MSPLLVTSLWAAALLFSCCSGTALDVVPRLRVTPEGKVYWPYFSFNKKLEYCMIPGDVRYEVQFLKETSDEGPLETMFQHHAPNNSTLQFCVTVSFRFVLRSTAGRYKVKLVRLSDGEVVSRKIVEIILGRPPRDDDQDSAPSSSGGGGGGGGGSGSSENTDPQLEASPAGSVTWEAGEVNRTVRFCMLPGDPAYEVQVQKAAKPGDQFFTIFRQQPTQQSDQFCKTLNFPVLTANHAGEYKFKVLRISDQEVVSRQKLVVTVD